MVTHGPGTGPGPPDLSLPLRPARPLPPYIKYRYHGSYTVVYVYMTHGLVAYHIMYFLPVVTHGPGTGPGPPDSSLPLRPARPLPPYIKYRYHGSYTVVYVYMTHGLVAYHIMYLLPMVTHGPGTGPGPPDSSLPLRPARPLPPYIKYRYHGSYTVVYVYMTHGLVAYHIMYLLPMVTHGPGTGPGPPDLSLPLRPARPLPPYIKYRYHGSYTVVYVYMTHGLVAYHIMYLLPMVTHGPGTGRGPRESSPPLHPMGPLPPYIKYTMGHIQY